MNSLGYVYRFIDNNGEIVYIGQAKNINHRLNSHFNGTAHLPDEVYESIFIVQYAKVDSEYESSQYEKLLINKYSPKYNERLFGHYCEMSSSNDLVWTDYDFNKRINRLKEINKWRSDSINLLNNHWKDVKGYEGLYMVSDNGYIKSLDRIDNMGRLREGRLLYPQKRNGYLEVCLKYNDNKKNKKIHRLVAESFLSLNEGDSASVVDHIDSNRENNDIKNLRVVDQQTNIKNAYSRLIDFQQVQRYRCNSFTEEEWKDIVGYEGLYKISSHGKIKNLKRDKIIKNSYDKSCGNYRVTLSKNNNKKVVTVKSLMAEHFLVNLYSFDNCLILFKDEDNSNHNFNNLYYAPKNYNKYKYLLEEHAQLA